MKVTFIGAGPGDPDLITVKGKERIDQADTIIYAGSLVNPALFSDVREGARLYNSAHMTLDEVIETIERDVRDGREVVRVHTGDPSLYGAIREQIDRLEADGFTTEIIPGVSSFSAAAAALRREYTLPDVSQSLIITRMAGRTPVPGSESLEHLAAHQSSMVLFLSAALASEVEEALLTHYPPDTPVAIVKRASWPDEEIYTCALSELASTMQAHAISKTALILVGKFLGDAYALSKLYDPGFSHGYRTPHD